MEKILHELVFWIEAEIRLLYWEKSEGSNIDIENERKLIQKHRLGAEGYTQEQFVRASAEALRWVILNASLLEELNDELINISSQYGRTEEPSVRQKREKTLELYFADHDMPGLAEGLLYSLVAARVEMAGFINPIANNDDLSYLAAIEKIAQLDGMTVEELREKIKASL